GLDHLVSGGLIVRRVPIEDDVLRIGPVIPVPADVREDVCEVVRRGDLPAVELWEHPVPARGPSKGSLVGPPACDPHRRTRLLHRCRVELHVLQRVVVAAEAEASAAPEAVENRESFVELVRPHSVVRRLSKELELRVWWESESRAEDQAAVRKTI